MFKMKFGSESDDINLALQKITRYQFDVFLSYSKKNERIAKKLYKFLTKNDFAVFFAPMALKDAELKKYNRWVDPLNQGLQHSCNFIALMSSTYLASSWCLLELFGFRNLKKGDYVLANSGISGIKGFGRVTGEYYYDSSLEYHNDPCGTNIS